MSHSPDVTPGHCVTRASPRPGLRLLCPSSKGADRGGALKTLARSRSPLVCPGEELVAPVSPVLRSVVPGCRHLSAVTGGAARLSPLASEGSRPPPSPLEPEQRAEPPSRTQLGAGAQPEMRFPRRAWRPEAAHPDFTATREEFPSLPWLKATAMLTSGSEHRATCRSPKTPKCPASGGEGGEMIHPGNFHGTAIKSFRGGDSICIPLPATSQCHLSKE